jgi:NTE family protein
MGSQGGAHPRPDCKLSVLGNTMGSASEIMQKERPSPGAPSAALVLCGGGSGGAVEVGLYRALVELGIHIDFVVGSSIGSVNGALIAAGLSPGQVAGHWRKLRTADVVGSRWQFVRLLSGAPSVFTNQRLRNFLRSRLPMSSFHELPVPLAIVATDLETGETVVLTEGDLVEAILASTALPGLFPPVVWQERQLVDGGLSNNVPIDLAVERGGRAGVRHALRLRGRLAKGGGSCIGAGPELLCRH